MIGKLTAVLLPFLLAAATVVDDGDACFTTYSPKCCALGDGTANSGFTPGQKTRCVNSALGSPWLCPNPNPPLDPGYPRYEHDDSITKHTGCKTGETNCQTEWRTLDGAGKCKARRYTCSTTMHGVCSAAPVAVEWECKHEFVFGEECFVYPDSDAGGSDGE